ncbi:MAG: hypothetical protein RSA90_00335 [Lachnospiraceae bacterium]
MAVRRQQQTYIYGNTVRQPEIAPRRREEIQPRQPKKVSTQVRKNRKKAMHMSTGYVVFLTVAAVMALVVCVQYLQLQSEISNRSKKITQLQQELASTKESNDTIYNNALDSVNIEEIRDKAVNEMGMVYAQPGQIIEYQNPTNDYVKQYEDIPKNGVLAQSNKVTK